ncbi:unnamed protein product [Xylocopa violacea]|uniref:Uncharacterized protein n=1 Tax=Xylocopa violacea TaxID=135666 RepID=A0ABP1PE12_XYLVO
MYKTVRKGDASLQYTILPQTDQFPATGFPQTSGKSSPRVIKYAMGMLMVLIILSCVATPFLMNQNDQSLFAGTVLAMGRVGQHSAMPRNTSRSQGKEVNANKSRTRLPATGTASSTEAYRKQDLEDEASTLSGMLKADGLQSEDFTTTDSTVSSTQHIQTTTESSTSVRQTSPSTPSTPPSTLSSTSSTNLKTLTSVPSEEAPRSSSSSPPWKAKMPRVTLKLRENETIPQMYMKAGIASYKKGNITTSVLAHGLSLEGLIFKTPEGTIKPWPQKWFFTDPSSDFQWKGLNQMPIRIYIIVLALFAALASVSISFLLYAQRKATRRQRQSVEEPEVEGHEEDKSTLLGAEGQEAEEKE